jgi:hypothetical protein
MENTILKMPINEEDLKMLYEVTEIWGRQVQ